VAEEHAALRQPVIMGVRAGDVREAATSSQVGDRNEEHIGRGDGMRLRAAPQEKKSDAASNETVAAE